MILSDWEGKPGGSLNTVYDLSLLHAVCLEMGSAVALMLVSSIGLTLLLNSLYIVHHVIYQQEAQLSQRGRACLVLLSTLVSR